MDNGPRYEWNLERARAVRELQDQAVTTGGAAEELGALRAQAILAADALAEDLPVVFNLFAAR